MNLYSINSCILHLGNLSKLYEETSPNWILSLMGCRDTRFGKILLCRAEEKKKLDSEVEAVEDPTETLDEQIDGNSECEIMQDTACETDDCSWMLDKVGEVYAFQAEIAQLKKENCSLQAEVANLKKKLQSASLSAEYLENDKNKLKFYTGNNASYFLLLNAVSMGLTE